MKKRAAGMVVVSALLCGIVAWQAPQSAPQEQGSAPEQTIVAELKPNTENITFEMQNPVGIARAIGLKDVLTPASDYDQIFPYAAEIVGWKEDGTPVYRYALADSAGELITNPIYTAVERKVCQGNIVWLLTDLAEDGSTQISCAAQDGSWVLGPFDGQITVDEARIFVQRTHSAVTTVYGGDGKIIGQVNGTLASCTDGVIVSQETTDDGTVWHISSADSAVELANLTAVHVGAFSDGSATVQLTETEWGFVNEKGVVTETDAAWIDESCDGYALAKDADGKFGVLSASGRQAAKFEYSNGAQCGSELPLYQLWTAEDTCIVLSAPKGQKLMLPSDLHAQQLTALPENYFAYLNEDGCTVVFDDLDSVTLKGEAAFYRQGQSLVAAMEDGYQLFDLEEGKAEKLRAYRYVAPQEQAAYEDSVFTIADSETGLQGIGNTRGRVVLDTEYNSIASVDGSYFAAVHGCWSGIVDSNGNWIVRTLLTGMN